MFRISRAGFLLGILLLLPWSANSQMNVYVGPHIGIQKSQDAQNANNLVGATMRLRLLPVLGAESDIGYRQEKYGSDALTVRSWPVTITGLIYPLPIIYGGLGAGWYNTTFDYANIYNETGFGDKTTHKLGWHLVAGIELPASPKINLFGDIRYVFIDYNLKDVPSAVLDGVNANFYSINFGVLFRL